jgi:hypothetical protein
LTVQIDENSNFSLSGDRVAHEPLNARTIYSSKVFFHVL